MQSISGIVREMIWNFLVLAFKAGKRLASVSVPSGRGVRAGNSLVLERISVDLLKK